MSEHSQDNQPQTLEYRPASEDRRANQGRLIERLFIVVFYTGFGSVALFFLLCSSELSLRLIGVSLIVLLIGVGLFALQHKGGSR